MSWADPEFTSNNKNIAKSQFSHNSELLHCLQSQLVKYMFVQICIYLSSKTIKMAIKFYTTAF